MPNILELQEVSRSFGDFKLDRISLTLPRGYIMGFIGPNGAGKTTTIKLIMNLIKRDSGRINIFGQDNIINQKEIKQKIGFVYDENYFFEELTVDEMKRVAAPFYRNWDEKRYRQYLGDFELPPRRKIKDLSRGMKTKFSLALAFSHQAELIIMDEPTSGLDPVFRSELLDILQREMQDEKKGILFSTHITSDLEKIADYICFINKGHIILSDTREEIINTYLLVKGPKDLFNERVRRLMLGFRESDFGFEGLTHQPGEMRKLLGNQVVYEKPSLDQVMLYTVRGDKHDSSN